MGKDRWHWVSWSKERGSKWAEGLGLAPVSFTLATICIVVGMGCSRDLTYSQVEPDFHLTLRVVGGYPGVDFSLELDGETGILTGEACTSGCGFYSEEVIDRLVPSETEWVATQLGRAGIHSLDGTDFGESCCDFTHFELTLHDPLGTFRISGSSDRLPARIRAVSVALSGRVRRVQGLPGQLPGTSG
jgi:hypothetical protein